MEHAEPDGFQPRFKFRHSEDHGTPGNDMDNEPIANNRAGNQR
jgi:hypothetical protein